MQILRIFEWTERSNRTHMGFLCITSYRLQVKIGFWHTRNLRILLCLVDCICIRVSKVEEFYLQNSHRLSIEKKIEKPVKSKKIEIHCAAFFKSKAFSVFFPWNCRKIETHLPIWFWEKVKVFSGISGQEFSVKLLQ